MSNFSIQDNKFESGSSVINQYTENNFGWGNVAIELKELSGQLNTTDSLKQALEELEAAVAEKDENKTKKTIKKYIADFTTATFANLASAGLLQFIHFFVP